MTKEKLREHFLSLRAGLSEEEKAAAASALCQRFLEEVVIPAGGVVAGYWPVKNEINVIPTLKYLSSQGHVCALPVIEEKGKPLRFAAWKEGDAIQEGLYGISIPTTLNFIVPDVLLVPLVAFDTAKHRIGSGAGFYDRTIAALRREKKISAFGIAYDFQKCNHVPLDETDIPMDMIITDKDIYR